MQDFGLAAAPFAMRTRSVEHAREYIAGVFTRHGLSSRGRDLDFSHAYVDRRRVSLNRMSYGTEVIIEAPALERFYLLQLTLAGSCEIELGRRTLTMREGELIVINPTRPYRKRWSADCTQLIARIDRELVADAWTARHGDAPAHPLEFVFATVPGTAAPRIEALLRAAHRLPAADRTLADALVAMLPPAEADAAVPDAARIVGRALAFMDAHLGAELTVGDIAQAAGTTARTLERAFRRERDATAVAALRSLRLERARALLLEPGESRSVTDIAVSVGLTHPGRFAADYARLYGESPSQTLRRARRLVHA